MRTGFLDLNVKSKIEYSLIKMNISSLPLGRQVNYSKALMMILLNDICILGIMFAFIFDLNSLFSLINFVTDYFS